MIVLNACDSAEHVESSAVSAGVPQVEGGGEKVGEVRGGAVARKAQAHLVDRGAHAVAGEDRQLVFISPWLCTNSGRPVAFPMALQCSIMTLSSAFSGGSETMASARRSPARAAAWRPTRVFEFEAELRNRVLVAGQQGSDTFYDLGCAASP